MAGCRRADVPQEQKVIAERVTKDVQNDPAKMKTYEGPTITTEIRCASEDDSFTATYEPRRSPATKFYKAEDYHQLYLDANPGGYCNHRLKWN